MIFVTVGTHEQQFDRLIRFVDEWKNQNDITEEVIIQTGFSKYKPIYCQWSEMFPYQKMVEYAEKARVIITHGGPSSIMLALRASKIPIVVPRQQKYDEHVNNHQLEFSRFIQKHQGNIIMVEDVEALKGTLEQYDFIIEKMPACIKNHNQEFNRGFEEIVDRLLS